jgi:Family of unknown function (DUF6335)
MPRNKKGRTRPAGSAPPEAPGTAAERPERRAEVHTQSPTAVAAEAMSTGVGPSKRVTHVHEAGRDSDLLQVGDSDVDPLGIAFVGDEAPGGDMSTPDQGQVDEIGHAYGVADVDDGELRGSAEVLEQRDRNRYALETPRPGRGTRGDDREE